MSVSPTVSAASPAAAAAGANHRQQHAELESPEAKQQQQPPREDSDCESDSSEVLSVGNEPPPTLAELEPAAQPSSKYSGAERNSSVPRTSSDDNRTSRTPSPASSTSSYRRTSGSGLPQAPSPPGYSQPASSPSASSVRSPASSSMTASSPGRPEFSAQELSSLPRYSSTSQQQHLLKYPREELDYPRLHAGLGHEMVYPGVERLHRTPISVPVVTRLSLSPPSAMTVSGLQLPSAGILHPTACRELGLPGQPLLPHSIANHLQPAAQHSATLHRLSVSKLLQRESPENEPATPHQQLLLNGRCASNSSNGLPGDSHASSNNNNSNNNNNNNTQHQASLKFSIDNILKADFGRRITDPLKKSRPKKLAVRPIDLSKDFAESSSEGSERAGSETSSTRNVSPSLPASSPAPSNASTTPNSAGGSEPSKMMQWPAWVYCTRYSDRPSSGPRTRRPKRPSERPVPAAPEEKRPRTAFSAEQLARLKREFNENKYLTEQRRQTLSKELGLNEAQIKIWFQNKRAKIKKASGQKNPLALQLMAQGLYNHSTVPLSKEEMEQAAELQAK